MTAGMGSAAANVHKDVYKAAKVGLTDRAMPVRRAAALVCTWNIHLQIISSVKVSFIITSHCLHLPVLTFSQTLSHALSSNIIYICKH